MYIEDLTRSSYNNFLKASQEKKKRQTSATTNAEHLEDLDASTS
jgi:hypothetical protein